jgi:hypothetical protein
MWTLIAGEGSKTVWGEGKDQAGNIHQVTAVIELDQTKPVIALVNPLDNPQNVFLGDAYVEAGATVSDNFDTGLSAVIDASAVVTSVVGDYPVYYDVTDAAGNVAVRVTRTVHVFNQAQPPSLFTVPTSSTTGDFTLTWSASADAEGYEIEESTTGTFTGVATYTVGLGSTESYLVTGRVPGTYYYQIRAVHSVMTPSDWVDGGILGCGVVYNYTIATYAQLGGTVTSSSGALSVAGGVWGSEIISGAETFTYTITPNPGYLIDDVLVNGVSMGGISGWVFSNVLSTQQIRVYFKPEIFSFTVSVYSGQGTVNSSTGLLSASAGWATESINSDNSITYTAIPYPGYKVLNVIVDGVSLGPLNSYVILKPVIMNHQIRVYYEEETYTVSAYSAAQGVMTSSSGNLTSSGAWVNEPIRRGQSFVYTFTPNAGYKVLAVLVDGVSLGSVNSYVIPKPVLRNHQIRVYYEEETYTVSAYSAAQGVITSSSGNLTSSGAWVYESIRRGQSFVYTFAPNAGYKVLDVLVDGVSLGSVNSYVIPKPVLINHQIRVYYEEDTYTVSAYSAAQGVMTSSSGNLTSSGAWVYEPIFSSQSFVYTFTPNAGYKVLDVLVDGISLGSVNSYAIPIPVIKNHQIRVYYEIE